MGSDDDRGRSGGGDGETASRRLLHAVGRADDLVLLLDASGHISYANANAVATYGYPQDDLIGRSIHDLDPDFPASTWTQHWASLKRCGTLTVSVRHRTRDGRTLPVEIKDTWVELDGAEYSILVVRDLSHRPGSTERTQLMKFSIDRLDESVYWIGPDTRVLYANDAACRNLGYASDELIGMSVAALDPNFPQEIWPLHWEELKQRQRLRFETQHRRRDGTLFPVEITANYVQIGAREFNCAFARDITERKVAEGQLRQMATRDALTGLPNRTLLGDRIERQLAHAARHDQRLAVLFLNLDRMQQINYDHGHGVGDQAIVAAARRLESSLRDLDTLAHWGDDAFVVLIPELAEPEHAGDVAQKLLDTLRLPLAVAGAELVLTASLGIALYPQDGLDAETLLKNADIAMFRAKEFGGDTVQYFSADLHPDTAERIRTLLALRRALANDELELHYQPLVNLLDDTPFGVEALVRWNRERHGQLLPEAFLGTAEETGFMLELGARVLDLACAQLAAWRQAGVTAGPLTVNVSPRQLRDPELAAQVTATLARHGLDPADLHLDLPHQLLSGSSPAVTATLEALAAHGVGLGIDDVGHAPAHFALLQQLPLSLLKLDARLIAAIASDPAAAALAAALTGAAHCFGTLVLAEGVGDAATLARSRELGCDLAQGRALAAPMTASACAAWLSRHTP